MQRSTSLSYHFACKRIKNSARHSSSSFSSIISLPFFYILPYLTQQVMQYNLTAPNSCMKSVISFILLFFREKDSFRCQMTLPNNFLFTFSHFISFVFELYFHTSSSFPPAFQRSFSFQVLFFQTSCRTVEKRQNKKLFLFIFFQIRLEAEMKKSGQKSKCDRHTYRKIAEKKSSSHNFLSLIIFLRIAYKQKTAYSQRTIIVNVVRIITTAM